MNHKLLAIKTSISLALTAELQKFNKETFKFSQLSELAHFLVTNSESYTADTKQAIADTWTAGFKEVSTQLNGTSHNYLKVLAEDWKKTNNDPATEEMICTLINDARLSNLATPPSPVQSEESAYVQEKQRLPMVIGKVDFNENAQFSNEMISQTAPNTILFSDIEFDDILFIKSQFEALKEAKNETNTITIVCHPKQGIPALGVALLKKMSEEANVSDRVSIIGSVGTEAHYNSIFSQKPALCKLLEQKPTGNPTDVLNTLDGFARTHMVCLKDSGMTNAEIVDLIQEDYTAFKKESGSYNFETVHAEISSVLSETKGSWDVQSIASLQTALDHMVPIANDTESTQLHSWKQQGGYNTRTCVSNPCDAFEIEKGTSYAGLVALSMQLQLQSCLQVLDPKKGTFQLIDPTAMIDPATKTPGEKNISEKNTPQFFDQLTRYSKENPTSILSIFFREKTTENLAMLQKDYAKFFKKQAKEGETPQWQMRQPFYDKLGDILTSALGENFKELTVSKIGKIVASKDIEITKDSVDALSALYTQIKSQAKTEGLKLPFTDKKVTGIVDGGLGQTLTGDLLAALTEKCAAVSISGISFAPNGLADYTEMSGTGRTVVFVNPATNFLQDPNLLTQKLAL